MVVLDSDRNFIMAANFDTADPSKGEGVRMAKFLQQLPQERIVLIGTQGTTGKYDLLHLGIKEWDENLSVVKPNWGRGLLVLKFDSNHVYCS